MKQLLGVIRKNRFLFLLGVLGLILLLIEGRSPAEPATSPIEAAEAYRAALTAELETTAKAMKGVGDARVLLTLSSTEIAVYEKNRSGESENVASASGEPLLLAYRMPEVAGVTVLCTGGGDAAVVRELTAMLRAALGVNTAQIHIAPLK